MPILKTYYTAEQFSQFFVMSVLKIIFLRFLGETPTTLRYLYKKKQMSTNYYFNYCLVPRINNKFSFDYSNCIIAIYI